MADVTFTWLGHGSYRFDSADGKRIYVDPWFDNPKCPESEKQPERCDVLAVTHGHGDHVGSAAQVVSGFSPTVIGIVELATWLEGQGASNTIGMNKGGTVDADGVKFTMTQAVHSGGFAQPGSDPVYLGEPAGFVIEFESGLKVYCAGDTDEGSAKTDAEMLMAQTVKDWGAAAVPGIDDTGSIRATRPLARLAMTERPSKEML